MKKRKPLAAALAALCLLGFAVLSFSAQSEQAKNGEIRLLVRGDDIGSCHAANVACIQCYREGIVRSVEVMAPTPWFNEAVKMLRENPQLDVGVHLDLTAEWEDYRWGPITPAPSLVDAQGCFFPMTRQRQDFPPSTGFLDANPKIDEVEKELRAQIELAVKRIPQVSHLSCHMGTARATPELRAVVDRLAKEYGLPVDLPGARRPPGRFGGSGKTPQEMEAALVETLEGLEAGLWLIVEHPGLDTPEMRAIGHKGYRDVAAHRAAVTHAFTSAKVKAVVKRRRIRLVSYADALQDR